MPENTYHDRMKNSPYILVSSRKPWLPDLRGLCLGHDFILHRQSHKSSENPTVICKRRSMHDQIPDRAKLSSTFGRPCSVRLRWHERMDVPSIQRSATKVHVPFSSLPDDSFSHYAPFVRELLKGLWSLDQDPLWLLVDHLVATGEPPKDSEVFPEFSRWNHVVQMANFSDAITSLVAQGHLRDPTFAGDVGDKFPGTNRAGPIPTWLVVFMLATKIKTCSAAHEGLAFCLSQLDHTPAHSRIPLLLLAMCALSTHDLAPHVTVLLGSFHDVFSLQEGPLVGIEGKLDRQPDFEAIRSLGSRETIIYQYNVLLTLLSRFPNVPRFAMRICQLLRHMETCGVPMETGTAKQLITSRFASGSLVHTVRDILNKQESAQSRSEPSNDLSIPLTRFFSKRFNPKEVARYLDASRRINLLKHTQTYLLSFREAAASLSYLRTIEAERENIHYLIPTRAEDGHKPEQQKTLFSTPPDFRRQNLASPFESVPMRHIYTSLLYSAAVSKTISASTFRAFYDSIRVAHGNDKVLETVALSGMLKRRAWADAKDLWIRWQTENASLRLKHRKIQEYFDRRNRQFGDAKEVRQALGWTHLRGYLLWRTIKRMKVDATALAVAVRAIAGRDTNGLLEAFQIMDGFAFKVVPINPSSTASNASDPRSSMVVFPHSRHPPHSFRPQDVQLTSRVINCFMTRALQLRRPDIIFRLWDGMTPHYGVDASVATLDILLRSARIAASRETTFSRVVPYWLKGTPRDLLRGKFMFSGLSEEICWMLGPNYAPEMRWYGAPAWRVARRVFREEILFANWPSLKNVQIPAKAMKRDQAMGQIEAFKEFSMDGGLWGTQIRRMGNYPHLVPGPRTFREYVLMLGRVQRSSEIPEVLAWMKALDVRPSRRTLSICLALWAEVGLGSPLDDVWIEPRHPQGREQSERVFEGDMRYGTEHSKLMTWLEDWIGKDEVPGDVEVLDSLRYIHELEIAEGIRD